MKKSRLVQSLAFGLLLAVSIVSGWHFMLKPKVTVEQPPKTHTNNIHAGAVAAQPNTTTKKIAPDDKNQSALLKTKIRPLSEQELAELIDRRLLPSVRDEINNYLRPRNLTPQEKAAVHGSFIDLSDRSSSVMIAIIDDDNNTVVADIMQPLPETIIPQ